MEKQVVFSKCCSGRSSNQEAKPIKTPFLIINKLFLPFSFLEQFTIRAMLNLPRPYLHTKTSAFLFIN